MDEIDGDEKKHGQPDIFGKWLLGITLAIAAATAVFVALWSVVAVIPLAAVLIPTAYLYWQAQVNKRRIEQPAAPDASTNKLRPPRDRAFLSLEIKAAVDRGDWDRVAVLSERMHPPMQS